MKVLGRERSRPGPSLVVMYGRRRVGKSTLILRALEGAPRIYYQATRVTDTDNQELFKRAATRAHGDDTVLAGLSGWEALLDYCRRLTESRLPGLTVVLDEFPYLVDDNKALPSIVQKVWDTTRASGNPLKLILCGSAVSFMEELLAERNPLHGRQSAELEVTPLSLREAAEFFPGWSADDQLRAYGVFGGMPYYLSLCEPDQPLAENILDLTLLDGAPLRDEPDHVLQAELQNVARYASILRAVADGCTKRPEIMNRVLSKGESTTSLTPYFHKLEALRLIRREASLDVRDPDRTRNARFFLEDPFLAFHFRFVLPYRSALEAGQADAVFTEAIAPRLDEYMGERFEEMSRQYVRLHASEFLPSAARVVGRIWASDYDVDVAATLLNGDRVAGECKWWQSPVGANVLDRLRETSRSNKYYRSNAQIHDLVFSRNGFTDDLSEAVSSDPRIALIDLQRMLRWR